MSYKEFGFENFSDYAAFENESLRKLNQLFSDYFKATGVTLNYQSGCVFEFERNSPACFLTKRYHHSFKRASEAYAYYDKVFSVSGQRHFPLHVVVGGEYIRVSSFKENDFISLWSGLSVKINFSNDTIEPLGKTPSNWTNIETLISSNLCSIKQQVSAFII